MHQKSIPESIYNQLFEHIEKTENTLIANFDFISNKDEFLKDTRYLDETISDFFSTEDDDTDMSFIKKSKNSDHIF